MRPHTIEEIVKITTGAVAGATFAAIAENWSKEHVNFMIGAIAGMELIQIASTPPYIVFNKIPRLLIIGGAITAALFDKFAVGAGLFTASRTITALVSFLKAYNEEGKRLYHLIDGISILTEATAVGVGLAGEVKKRAMSWTAASMSFFNVAKGGINLARPTDEVEISVEEDAAAEPLIPSFIFNP